RAGDASVRRLLGDDGVEAEVRGAGPAQLLRDGHAEKAVLARLEEELARDDSVALPRGGVRDDLPGQKGTKRLAEQVVLVLIEPGRGLDAGDLHLRPPPAQRSAARASARTRQRPPRTRRTHLVRLGRRPRG